MLNVGLSEVASREKLKPREIAGRRFSIVVSSNSTTGLFLVNAPVMSVVPDRVPDIAYMAMDSTYAWVDRIVYFAGLAMENAALKEISVVTTKLKSSNGIAQISSGFNQLSKHKLPSIIAVALLRNTYTFRSEIANWAKFLNETERALIISGKDAKKVLRGLK